MPTDTQTQPPPSLADALPAPELPPIYYDSDKKQYWYQDSREKWIPRDIGSIRRVLKTLGYPTKVATDAPLSPSDEALFNIEQEQNVRYAGPLAGYMAGPYSILGNPVLVTSSPALIEPGPGDWPLLETVMMNMLGQTQTEYVCAWLKVAVETLRAGKRRGGQALVIAGPANCGKSLLQNIITQLIGGRAAKPYQAMTGVTSFNSHLFAAEHLMIEDEVPSTDFRTRRAFGTQIKQITACDTQNHHKKHGEALSLTPFWRLSVTINDEPEDLLVLPPMDDSIEDKLILLKAERREMPMPTTTPTEKEAFWEALMTELPSFVAWLLEWEIPHALQSPRFGVAHYHNPELLQALEDLAAERKLLALIDETFFPSDQRDRWVEWSGTAEQLRARLEDMFQNETRRLLTFPTACGVYLARLAKGYSYRVRKQAGRRPTWVLLPPPPEE